MALGTPTSIGTRRVAGTTTVVLTTTASVPAGAMIFVLAATPNGDTVAISSCADSVGNTYTAGTSYTPGGSTAARIRPFWVPNATALGSGGTITVTCSGTGEVKYLSACYVTGADTTTPLSDEGPGQGLGLSSTSISTGTLSNANCVVFGIIAGDSLNNGAFSSGTGFTTGVDNAGGTRSVISYKLVTSTASVTYNPSWVGNSDGAVNWIAFKEAGGGPTNVALTGVTGTGSVGSVSPAFSIALSGVTGTGSVGSVASSSVQSVALTGVTGTGSVGTVTPAVAYSVALTGVSATGSVGTVSSTSVQSVALTGVSATSSVGSVLPTFSLGLTAVTGTGSVGSVAKTFTIPLSGLSATGTVGTVSPTAASSIALTGVTGTGSVGSLGKTFSVALSGVTGSGTVGVVTPLTGTVVQLTGVTGTGSVGDVTPVAAGRLRYIPTILNFEQFQLQLNDILGVLYGALPGYGDDLPDPNGQVDGRLFVQTPANDLYQLQQGVWTAL